MSYILTMNSIFLLYVLYYYHMCYIITVCACLSFGGLAQSYIVNVCAWIDPF